MYGYKRWNDECVDDCVDRKDGRMVVWMSK